jgi:hypothetical protein
MWKFLLDPVFQGVAFVLVFGALAFVAWDLWDETRNPSPAMGVAGRRRRSAARAAEAPRARAYVEPCLEIWTDSQGVTRGRIKRGPCRGQKLEEMSREDCEQQAAYAREHDPASAPALESYIRQHFSQRRRYEARPDGEMSRAEAYAELGLAEGASVSQIHAAYRAAIKKHHPDHGGSHAKAARINRAKDLLEG